MRILSTNKIALRALRRNKLRSMLTALGIIIGVGAVIAMVSVGNGAKSQVEDQIAGLGENVILVFAGSMNPGGVHTGWGGASSLKLADATAIQKEIQQVTTVSPEIRSSNQVSAGNQNWFTTIQGESEEYLDLRKWALAAGANFTADDVRGTKKVAVIGQTVARQLYGDESPLGQIIRIKNVPFVVLGVLSPRGLSMMGNDQDDVVLLPYTSAMKRVTGWMTFRSFNIQADSPEDLNVVEQQVILLLRQHHNIRAGKDDDFTVRTQEEIAAAATATSRVMTVLLAAIASVSLIVGGIGIMNIMLVSVTERTREIGIRMAVGAHGRDIMLQFLIEAVTISSMGGIIGILIGLGTSKTLSSWLGWPTLVSISSVLVAFFFSAAVGIFFGFYPARKASLLDPIDALRYE